MDNKSSSEAYTICGEKRSEIDQSKSSSDFGS